MNLVYLGQIVNTHGIKGEIRIVSNFKEKKQVFKKGTNIYLNENESLTINTYRPHKNYDMITFVGINDINDVLQYKTKKVYINKNDFKLTIPLYEDYIDSEVYIEDKFIGYVTDILDNKAHEILEVKNDDKKYLIPNIKEFITKFDVENKKIYVENIKGLIDED